MNIGEWNGYLAYRNLTIILVIVIDPDQLEVEQQSRIRGEVNPIGVHYRDKGARVGARVRLFLHLLLGCENTCENYEEQIPSSLEGIKVSSVSCF